MSTALLSVQKNEAPYLLEFVAHHLAVGFKEIFLVTNPSDDLTEELADAMRSAGVIKHISCQTPDEMSPQDFGLSLAKSKFAIDDCEWLLVLDADELLNIRLGRGGIDDLIRQTSRDVDIVSVNIANFGNFPHSRWEDKDSSVRFMFRFSQMVGFSSEAKSLIRQPSRFAKLKPHGPVGFIGDRTTIKVSVSAGIQNVVVSSKNDSHYGFLRNPGANPRTFDFAQINHYSIRTFPEFVLRQKRGRGATPKIVKQVRHTQKYFESRAQARFFDDSILKYRDDVVAKKVSILERDKVRMVYAAAMDLFSKRMAASRSD